MFFLVLLLLPQSHFLPMKFDVELERVLSKASMKGKTVILTTLNDAWAEPGSVFDLFLESFQIGIETKKLLNNLKAHARCLAIHPHCYALTTEGLDSSTEAPFMSEDYLKMMWRRIEFLNTVLQMGYSFVFTDADIMWLRNPFPRFYPQVDFQIAWFTYVRSNPRTILFYRFWFMSRKTYPGKHDQDIELSMRFLDTAYFGGFCERSKDFNKVCTMHANCCYGLGTKVHDLKIVLEDWKNYTSLPPNERASASPSWRAPQNCRT
ncbi:Nucleotide-diphospho-sugar transferase protein [Salix suchowensis]|nr:Nucleotide-diphospho-sugar transferase protein [Salix suchowensis]